MVSMKHIPLVSAIVLSLTSHVTADFIEDSGLDTRGEDFLNDGLLLEARDDIDERDIMEELEVVEAKAEGLLMSEPNLVLMFLAPHQTDPPALVTQLEVVEAKAEGLLIREPSLVLIFLALHQTGLLVLVIQLEAVEAKAEGL
ncbi:unnamed protein product [Clonostachys byssicola]|uniref:Uncharacterized protein n=1 Tax=Clonostachys byssicola TaxID=160290 RepID=A0A9N9Y9V1_9HYPO|nr:unnamed protein product [Clonostachys byssicola]